MVILALEEPKKTDLLAMPFDVPVVHNGGDSSANPARRVGGEQKLHFSVFKKGVLAPVEESAVLRDQRRNPVGIVAVDLPRETNEPRHVSGCDGLADKHG